MFAGDGPATNVNQATLAGFPTVPTDQRRPFFAGNMPNTSGFTGPFGWTQGIDYFCNCATNAYDSLQTKFTKRFSERLFGAGELHAAARDPGQPRLLLLRLGDEPRPGRLGSHAQLDRCRWWRVAVRPRAPLLSNVSPLVDAIVGGWQANTNTFIYSGLPFPVTYRDAGADRDTGGNNRPNSIGDPEGPKTEEQWFNSTPIGSCRQRFRASGPGHVRDDGAECAARPGLLARRRLVLQAVHTSAASAGSRRASRP